MNIGILGAGNVGGALGQAWARAGHHIAFGSRNPGDAGLLSLVEKCGANARACTFAEAGGFGEVVAITLPWPVSRPVIESLELAGKVVLDCMNPLLPGLAGLEIGTTTSGGEQVAQWARGASVVKIFNTTGSNNMENPGYAIGAPTMLYCGDDKASKAVAAGLATDAGLAPQDCGPLENARLLEPFAMTWIWLAAKGGLGSEFIFQLIKR